MNDRFTLDNEKRLHRRQKTIIQRTPHKINEPGTNPTNFPKNQRTPHKSNEPKDKSNEPTHKINEPKKNSTNPSFAGVG